MSRAAGILVLEPSGAAIMISQVMAPDGRIDALRAARVDARNGGNRYSDGAIEYSRHGK
jgi:hypothetical protein